MKFPSISLLLTEAKATFFRFPIVIVNAFLGTFIALALVQFSDTPGSPFEIKILYATIVALPLLIAVRIILENYDFNKSKTYLIEGFSVLLAVVYMITLPDNLLSAPLENVGRLVALTITFHLLILVAPFLKKGDTILFWRFNKVLFYRVSTAALFAIVLYVGFSLALLSLNFLFSVDLGGKVFFQLWIIVVGLFVTWFVLAGIPTKTEINQEGLEYPTSLKVFAQYILLPILVLYFLILYTYIGKIVIGWDLPNGWVSGLIFGFSSIGLLALIILYPLRLKEENNWLRIFWKTFFPLLIPLLIMLYVALGVRINSYGITEGRYLAVVFGIWFAIITIYFIISSNKSIKIIPVSLFIIGLLIIYGPWSMFSLSESNQAGRLKTILEKNSILVNDKIQKTKVTVSEKDNNEISSIINYLYEFHGYGKIEPWFTEKLANYDTLTKNSFRTPASEVIKMIGIDELAMISKASGDRLEFTAKPFAAINISGYEKLLPVYTLNPQTQEFRNEELICSINKTMDTISLGPVDNKIGQSGLKAPLDTFVNQLLLKYESGRRRKIPGDSLSLAINNDKIKAKIVFSQIELVRNGNKFNSGSLTFQILYSIK